MLPPLFLRIRLVSCAASVVLGLAACGGHASDGSSPSSGGGATPSPAEEAGFAVVGENDACGGVAAMTPAAVRAKLPAAGSASYRLTYDGRATNVTFTFAGYGAEARCQPRANTGSVANGVALHFVGTADVRAEDGSLMGPFTVTAVVRAQDGSAVRTLEWNAQADASTLRGSLAPMLHEPGYDGHRFLLGVGRDDEATSDDPLAVLDLSEVTFTTAPYSQVGAPRGVLRRLAP